MDIFAVFTMVGGLALFLHRMSVMGGETGFTGVRRDRAGIGNREAYCGAAPGADPVGERAWKRDRDRGGILGKVICSY